MVLHARLGPLIKTMNDQTIHEIMDWSIAVLLALFCILVILFFVLILSKDRTLTKQAQQRDKWQAVIERHLHNGDPLPPIPNSDEAIVLALILEQAERDEADYSQAILSLRLERRLTADLNNNANKILAIKNIGVSKIPQSYTLLQSYWNARDFDESYFSLYYTLEQPHSSAQSKDILQAILRAVFSGERKVEMIRRLTLPNDYLLLQLSLPTRSRNERAILIASLRADALSHQEVLQLETISKSDLELQKALVLLLSQSNDPAALEILRRYIGPQQPAELRIEVAYRLGERQNDAALALLQDMLFDENWEVRTHSAVNLLKYGDRGSQYLDTVRRQSGSSAASEMANLHLSIHPAANAPAQSKEGPQ